MDHKDKYTTLYLEDDAPVPEKKDADQKGIIRKNPKGNIYSQEVHLVLDLENISSFRSASSSPSLARLPLIALISIKKSWKQMSKPIC